MRRRLFALAALLLAIPAAAQSPEWQSAPETRVQLRRFAYEPRIIRLRPDQPVRLTFVNNGLVSLSFSAPEFFRSARIHESDRDAFTNGRVILAPGRSRTISLAPRAHPAGRPYKGHSFNAIHRILGMTAVIHVE